MTESEESGCPHCGCESFSWGRIVSAGHHQVIGFVPDDAPKMSRLLGGARCDILTQACTECGRLELFANLPGTS